MAELTPELPTQQEYLASVRKVDGELQEVGVYRYFRSILQPYGNSHQDRRSIETAMAIASAVEPVDRSTGNFANLETTGGFSVAQGIFAGLLVARNAHRGIVSPSQIDRRLWTMGKDFGVEASRDQDDELQQRHDAASYIIDHGQRGLELIGSEAEEVVENWEMQVVKDVAHQRMFRIGAGVILMAAHDIHLARLLKEKEAEQERQAQEALREFGKVSHGVSSVDWDAELQSLLGGEAGPQS